MPRLTTGQAAITRSSIITIVVLACLVLAFRAGATVPADSSWSAEFAQVGTDDYVAGGFARGDSLFICGIFDHVGTETIRAVALFDGTTWSGFGAGLPDTVLCLTVWNGQLIAGGSFTRARGAPADYLATWDGTAWQPFPIEVNSRVDAFCEWNGMLVVGGNFGAAGATTLNNIGAWDGTQWHAFGTGMGWTNNREEVYALTVWQGKVIAGGRISSAGGVPVNNVAQWDALAWSPVSAGTNGDVYSFGLLEGGARLVIAGLFNVAGGLYAHGVASWDGATWDTYNGGTNTGAEAMCIYQGKIVITGVFDKAGGVKVKDCAEWDGTGWHPMGNGLVNNPWEFRLPRYYPAVIPYRGICIIGGFFQGGGLTISPNLVAWNDTTWLTMGTGAGVDFDIRSFGAYGERLIAGGNFITAGAAQAPYAGAWDGTTWSSLANGVNHFPVSAFMTFGGDLIAGGTFAKASGLTVNNIARWNGAAWSALGTGTNGSVLALTEYNGQLIAGGSFTTAGGVSVSRIASWNGTGWSAFAGGGADNVVSTLGVWNGQLVAGGRFTMIGGVSASCIATWDGTQWHALGAGQSGSNNSQMPGPQALAQTVFNGQLVVGGNFTDAGGTAANYVAAWDGTQWSALGAGVDGQFSQAGPEVDALLVQGESLYVGGIFTEAGGEFAGYVATWDGTGWGTMGSGLHMKFPTGGGAFALAWYQGSLYVGRDMDTAGGKRSAYIARWDPPVQAPTAVRERRAPVGTDIMLTMDGPTPATDHVAFTYTLADKAPVRLEMFDSVGRSIRTLVTRVQAAGTYHATWDGTNRANRRVSAGVYFARLIAGARTATAEIVLGP